MNQLVSLIAIVSLILGSAFFSGSEMALSSANHRRLKKAAEQGGLKGRTAYWLFEHYDETLSTILIANNLVNNAASSIATVLALSLFTENATLFSTVFMTLIILAFGETVPKLLAKQDAEHFFTVVSLPLRVLMLLLYPLVFLVVKVIELFTKLLKKEEQDEVSVTEDELVSIIETIEDEGVIDEDQSDLLQSAVEFSDTIVKEILTPRVDMITIDIDDPLDEIIEELKGCPYSRIPVYEDTVDHIIGVLYVNELLSRMMMQEAIDLRMLMIEPFYINETMKLPDVLMELRRKHMHVAIVLDEYGGTLGMVTMEDILEELVGEIWDETDEIIDECKQLSEDQYEVDGEMNIHDFLDTFDLDDDSFESECTTVGGWVSEQLDDIPELHDEVTYENLLIQVTELDDIRASKLLVLVKEKQEE